MNIQQLVDQKITTAFPNIEIVDGEPHFGGYCNTTDFLYIFEPEFGARDITSEQFQQITGYTWAQYLDLAYPQ